MTAWQIVLLFAGYLTLAVLSAWAGACLSMRQTWREGREHREAHIARWDEMRRIRDAYEAAHPWQDEARAEVERIRRTLREGE